MSIMDEIEGAAWTEVEGVDDVCEICFQDEGYHEDFCPNNLDNKFFDEEIIIAESEDLL